MDDPNDTVQKEPPEEPGLSPRALDFQLARRKVGSSSVDTRVIKKETVAKPTPTPPTQGKQPAQQTPACGVDFEEALLYAATHTIKLFVPVSLCMVFVVIGVSSVSAFTDERHKIKPSEIFGVAEEKPPPYAEKKTPRKGEEEEEEEKEEEGRSTLAFAIFMLLYIIFATLLVLFLVKNDCHKFLEYWLLVSSGLMLFLFSFNFFSQVLISFNVAMDVFTLTLLVWNFGVVGLVCIHWKGPLLLQQTYLILMAAFMALAIITVLPEWTVWSLLGILVVWDLVAVLCPNGPLRLLLEETEKTDKQLPGMLYSTGDGQYYNRETSDSDESSFEECNGNGHLNDFALPSGSCFMDGRVAALNKTANNSDPSKLDTTEQPPPENPTAAAKPPGTGGGGRGSPQKKQAKKQQTKKPDFYVDAGIDLGLGDFVFYSVLVGTVAANGDWSTTLACFVAILVGMGLTLLLLAIYNTALPALPISIFFGLIFNFGTSTIIRPFCDKFASNQVFL